jgi:hypothetical protein
MYTKSLSVQMPLCQSTFFYICNSEEWESNSTGDWNRREEGVRVSRDSHPPLFILTRIRSRTRRASDTTSSSRPAL